MIDCNGLEIFSNCKETREVIKVMILLEDVFLVTKNLLLISVLSNSKCSH